MNRTNKFDAELKKISHYQKHQHMLPFIGQYWGDDKKLLVVAESHYLSNNKENLDFIKKWYEISSSDLPPKVREYTNTAGLLNCTGNNQKYDDPRAHSIYKNIQMAILKSNFSFSDKTNMFRYISFVNFFQRPAEKTGDSIRVNKQDIEIANQTMSEIIRIIEPEYIFFVSSKAWKYFDKSLFNRANTGHSCHPSCKWWNRKSKSFTKSPNKQSVTGQESFIDFMNTHNIFQTPITNPHTP